MDTFFTHPHCDHCGKALKNGRMMSMFSTNALCLDGIAVECQRSDYQQARETDHAEIRKGEFQLRWH